MVVNCQRSKWRQVAQLFQQLYRIISVAFPFAKHQSADQLAPHLQRNQTLEPDSGDVTCRAEQCVATLARQALRSCSLVERMNMFWKQRKDRGLRKDRKTGRRNRSQHGRPFLEAKQRA